MSKSETVFGLLYAMADAKIRYDALRQKLLPRQCYLKAIMAVNGLSLRQAAAMWRCSPSYLSMVCKSKTTMSPALAERIVGWVMLPEADKEKAQ